MSSPMDRTRRTAGALLCLENLFFHYPGFEVSTAATLCSWAAPRKLYVEHMRYCCG